MANDESVHSPVVVSLAGFGPPDRSTERLARLTASLDSYPEGREALQYAQDNHIPIRFASQYSVDETKLIDGNNAAYDPKTKAILLNPTASDDRIVSDIPHEVWHVDQDKKGVVGAMQQVENPTQKIGLKYVIEATAYTHQVLDGVPLPKDQMHSTADDGTLMDLRNVYDNAIKAHETPEAARLDVFKAALKFESHFDSHYESIVKLGDRMQALQELAPDDPKRTAIVGKTAEFSDEQLAQIMRRAGNISLSADSGNMFATMTDADLVQLSTSQLTPQNKEALRQTQASYEEVRRGAPVRGTR